jgi:ABC-2 type transport system ATP-binding protein
MITADLSALPGVKEILSLDGGFAADLVEEGAVPSFVRAVVALPFDLLGVAEEPPTLQEAYLALVGNHPAPAERQAV